MLDGKERNDPTRGKLPGPRASPECYHRLKSLRVHSLLGDDSRTASPYIPSHGTDKIGTTATRPESGDMIRCCTQSRHQHSLETNQPFLHLLEWLERKEPSDETTALQRSFRTTTSSTVCYTGIYHVHFGQRKQKKRKKHTERTQTLRGQSAITPNFPQQPRPTRASTSCQSTAFDVLNVPPPS